MTKTRPKIYENICQVARAFLVKFNAGKSFSFVLLRTVTQVTVMMVVEKCVSSVNHQRSVNYKLFLLLLRIKIQLKSVR